MKFQSSAQRDGSIRKAHRAASISSKCKKQTARRIFPCNFNLSWFSCMRFCNCWNGLTWLLRVFAGVSLPSTRLRRLSPVWLLPGGLLLAVMRRRDGPVPVQAWRHWSPVQRMRQPICWGHKFRLRGWEGFSPWEFVTFMFFTMYKISQLLVTFSAVCWNADGSGEGGFQASSVLSAVIYDGCPKTITQGIWWPRTKFNLPAAVPCPKGSVGAYSQTRPDRSCCHSNSSPPDGITHVCHVLSSFCAGAAIRHCDVERGWLEPELYNCTSPPFVELNAAVCEDYKSTKAIYKSHSCQFRHEESRSFTFSKGNLIWYFVWMWLKDSNSVRMRK